MYLVTSVRVNGIKNIPVKDHKVVQNRIVHSPLPYFSPQTYCSSSPSGNLILNLLIPCVSANLSFFMDYSSLVNFRGKDKKLGEWIGLTWLSLPRHTPSAVLLKRVNGKAWAT